MQTVCNWEIIKGGKIQRQVEVRGQESGHIVGSITSVWWVSCTVHVPQDRVRHVAASPSSIVVTQLHIAQRSLVRTQL